MSIYRTYTDEQLQANYSKFLVNTWSYSRVTSFARNEKGFEMTYIYGLYGKNSASTVAGQAYHVALQYYFTQLKEGVIVNLVELEQAAFAEIDRVPANYWKLQKTTPTIEECHKKATMLATALLKNFYTEKEVYEADLKEVIGVEVYGEEFVTVNGVDIPLPCQFVTDLLIRTKDDKIVTIDHKSKAVYTSEEEMALSIGVQAITYVIGIEAKMGLKVDEVWFIENKYSQNKDKSPQLHAFKVAIDADTRRLYEALLYEPLRRMLSAVSDPDYVYLINDSDSFVEMAEVYNFWCRTMTAEVDDFNIADDKKEMVAKRLKKIRDASIAAVNPTVIRNFKENAAAFINYDLSNKNMTPAQKIEHTLRSFGIIAQVAHMFEGYSSNTYLLEFSAGVRIASIHQHRLDIANALDVASVRISKDLVVHDGRSYLAVDFAKKRDRSLYWDAGELHDMRIPIGKDNFNNTIIWDLQNHSTPHMLICGATGSGKSAAIISILEYAKRLGLDKIVIFDPKFEFVGYDRHQGIEVHSEIEQIEQRMAELVDEMQTLAKDGGRTKTMVVFDEFADAVANSRKGNELKIYEQVCVGISTKGLPKFQRQCTGEHKSLEENLRILLQKGRSIGYRIVAATQRASVKVITGDAKVNFPVQVCFRVPKETDSRVVLDEAGAESLAGMGDGLIKSPEYKDVVRFQSYYYDSRVIMAHHDAEVGATIVQ